MREHLPEKNMMITTSCSYINSHKKAIVKLKHSNL